MTKRTKEEKISALRTFCNDAGNVVIDTHKAQRLMGLSYSRAREVLLILREEEGLHGYRKAHYRPYLYKSEEVMEAYESYLTKKAA